MIWSILSSFYFSMLLPFVRNTCLLNNSSCCLCTLFNDLIQRLISCTDHLRISFSKIFLCLFYSFFYSLNYRNLIRHLQKNYIKTYRQVLVRKKRRKKFNVTKYMHQRLKIFHRGLRLEIADRMARLDIVHQRLLDEWRQESKRDLSQLEMVLKSAEV